MAFQAPGVGRPPLLLPYGPPRGHSRKQLLLFIEDARAALGLTVTLKQPLLAQDPRSMAGCHYLLNR